MDEVFGSENFAGIIGYRKTANLTSGLLPNSIDWIIWYGKDKSRIKYRQILLEKGFDNVTSDSFGCVAFPDGSWRRLSTDERKSPDELPEDWNLFGLGDLTSSHFYNSPSFSFEGRDFAPKNRFWSTSSDGLRRLAGSNRIAAIGDTLRYKRMFADFPVMILNNVWDDIGAGSQSETRVYAVQTAEKAIERCILMTSDPGDLVFDPTCLRRGTRVVTSSGLKAVEEIQVGERVLTHTGDFKRVVKTMARPYKGRVIGLKRRGHHQTLWVTDDHPVRAVRTQSCPDGRVCHAVPECRLHRNSRYLDCAQPKDAYEESWIAAGNLSIGDYVVANAPREETSALDEELAYLVGLYLAEGFHDRNSLCFCFHEEETELIDAVSRLVPQFFNCSPGKQFNADPQSRAFKIRFHSRKAVAFFSQFGHRAATKAIPEWIMTASRTAQAQLLRGYFEGDGNLHRDGFRSGSTSSALSDLIARLLWRLGLVATVGRTNVSHSATSYPSKDPVFTVSIGGSGIEGMKSVLGESQKFASAPFATVLNRADKVGWGHEQNRIWAKIERLEECDSEEEVWNLTVEDDHSFVTEVCTVHNCGSGTTAVVAEQWGRRWITCDTSRVALAIARQRILTAKFEAFEFADEARGIKGGFQYKTVPHITLKSIAQNPHLDPIFARFGPQLDAALSHINAALGQLAAETRRALKNKLALIKKPTDADKRRLDLDFKIEHWQAPFDCDEEYPDDLKDAVTRYRRLWREKMDAVNAAIAQSAESETLYDKPLIRKNVVRVSGPFTVEAVQPPEMSLSAPEPLHPEPEEELPAFSFAEVQPKAPLETQNAASYLDNLIALLHADGLTFLGNRKINFQSVEAANFGSVPAHAIATWKGEGDETEQRALVSFGPQYGAIGARQVEEVGRVAYQQGFHAAIFAGFAFDDTASGMIQKGGRIPFHLAHIRPDMNPAMKDLLKTTNNSQLFSVFGSPRVSVAQSGDDWIVSMEGMDIYNPVSGEVVPTGAGKVAAWFLDCDYDGRTFRIAQAFFPDQNAWDKIAKALNGAVDVSAFGGTKSVPFPAGAERRVAVKVIDPRGNEVMCVEDLV